MVGGLAWGSAVSGPPGPLQRQSLERRWPVAASRSPRWALDPLDPNPDGRTVRQRAPRAGLVGFPPRFGEHAPPSPRGGSDSAPDGTPWSLEKASSPRRHGHFTSLDGRPRRVRRPSTPRAKHLKSTHGMREGRRPPPWRGGQECRRACESVGVRERVSAGVVVSAHVRPRVGYRSEHRGYRAGQRKGTRCCQ